MKHHVSASESALLRVARAVVGVAPVEGVNHLLRARLPVKGDQIGPSAMQALQSILRSGVVRSLAFANGGRVPAPWREPLHLSFTARSLQLLQWMAWGAPEAPFKPAPGGSRGDDLLDYLAAGVLVQSRKALPVHFGHNHLIQMAFPHMVQAVPSPDRWVKGDGATLLVALRPQLTAQLVALERAKAATSQTAALLRFAQHRVALEAFLDAADDADRRDLAGFILDACAQVLAPQVDFRWWVGSLVAEGRLADRQEAAQASASLLAATARIGAWHQEHGLVSFFDEEYDAAQRLLLAWESFGREGFERAAAYAHRLSTFDALGA